MSNADAKAIRFALKAGAGGLVVFFLAPIIAFLSAEFHLPVDVPDFFYGMAALGLLVMLLGGCIAAVVLVRTALR